MKKDITELTNKKTIFVDQKQKRNAQRVRLSPGPVGTWAEAGGAPALVPVCH